MRTLQIARPALDSLHALRLEPFLKLLSSQPPTYDPRAKAFTHRFPVTHAASALMLHGYMPLAMALRDSRARTVTLGYAGNRISISVTVEDSAGEPLEACPTTIAPGLDLALVELYRPSIEDALSRAERYLKGMSQRVYCSSELLINAARHGYTFRVRTDAPPIDAHLLSLLDTAMASGSAIVVCLRIARTGPDRLKSECLLPAKVISRHQPLRALAASELTRFIHSTQASPAISMRPPCPTHSSPRSRIT